MTSLYSLMLNRFKYLLILDIFLFILFTFVISWFQYISLVLTGFLFLILTNLLIEHFISLINSKRHDSPIKSKVLNFLFRNENLYELMKKLSTFKLSEQGLSESKKRLKPKEQVEKKREINMEREVEHFLKSFSKAIIESWYIPHVSNHPEFPTEVQRQVKPLLIDILKRFNQMNKLNFFARFFYIINKNFINLTFTNTIEIPLEILHPALQNPPISEISYLKRFVKVVLKNSSTDASLSEPFIQEMLTQLIGKNLFEKLVDLLSQPAFIYYAIALVLNKEKTKKKFGKENENTKKNEKDNENMTKTELFASQLSEEEFVERNVVFREKTTEKETKSRSTFFDYEYSPEITITIISLEITDTETVYELKSGRPYTLYNIRVNDFN